MWERHGHVQDLSGAMLKFIKEMASKMKMIVLVRKHIQSHTDRETGKQTDRQRD